MTEPVERVAAQSFHVALGETVSFAKTVGESDVYLFAGITGDFSENHVNEQYMRGSAFGRRVVHGALLVGFMSTTSTMMIARSVAAGISETPVSQGYDRVRFVNPVFIGDTVTVIYTIASVDPARRRSVAEIRIVNQDGTVVAVAQNILKWVPKPSAGMGTPG